MKIAQSLGTGATLLLMILGTCAIAAAWTAGILAILWIGAAYSWILLIPVLPLLILANGALKRKVNEQRKRQESAPPIEGPVANAFASAALVFPILTIAAGAFALYQAAQFVGWWPVAIIVAISFGCPWLADPFLPERAAAERDAAFLRESASRRVLAGAARYRAQRPGATARS